MNGLRYLNKSALLNIGVILIAFLVILGTNNSVFSVIAAFALLLLLIYVDIEECICITLFFLSFANVFKLSYDGSSFFTYLQVILLLKLLARNRVISKNRFFVMIVTTVYTLVNTLINNQSVSGFIKFTVAIFILCLFFCNDEYKKVSLERMVIWFSMGVLVAGIFGLFKSSIPSLSMYLYSNYARIDESTIAYRYSGLSGNPNYYSIDITVAVASLSIMYLRDLLKRIHMILLGGLIILGILTQSKAFMLSLILIIIMSIILSINDTQKNVQIVLIVGCIIALGLVLVPIIGLDIYFNRFLSSFGSEASINTFTTGRFDIWIGYVNEIFQSFKILFIGNGIEVTSKVVGIDPHNAYIQLVYNFGIIGATLYFFVMKDLVCSKPDKYYYIILFSILFRLFGANIAFSLNVFYYYLLAGVLKSKV